MLLHGRLSCSIEIVLSGTQIELNLIAFPIELGIIIILLAKASLSFLKCVIIVVKFLIYLLKAHSIYLF